MHTPPHVKTWRSLYFLAFLVSWGTIWQIFFFIHEKKTFPKVLYFFVTRLDSATRGLAGSSIWDFYYTRASTLYHSLLCFIKIRLRRHVTDANCKDWNLEPAWIESDKSAVCWRTLNYSVEFGVNAALTGIFISRMTWFWSTYIFLCK